MRDSVLKKISIYFFVFCFLVFFIGPIVWFFALAIRPPETAFQNPPSLIFNPTIEAFKFIFVEPGNSRSQLFNSLLITSTAIIINLPMAFSAAYALSRFKIKGKQFIMGWYLGLLMGPAVVFLLPYFILMNNIGLSGTKLSMILVLQVVTVPFSIWLLKSFLDELPVEIEEAAQVDGAGTWKILTAITIPLCRPGIIVTTMFAFVFAWNNVLFPIILANSESATLQIGVFSFFSSSGVQWGIIAAISLVAIIIPMLIFLSLDKYVVRGLTFGAVKG